MRFIDMFKMLKSKMNKNEVAAVKISLLIAALDGDVSKNEFERFHELVRSCDGYTADEIEKTCIDAIRSAGYLMLLARIADKKVVVDAFISEANKILPLIFDMGKEAIQDAVNIWQSMAGADGNFSEVERAAIQNLESFLSARCEAMGTAYAGGFCIR